MDRDIEQDPRELAPESGASRRAPADRNSRVRQPLREERQVYSVSPDERQTMYDIGRFRTINTADLAGLKYLGKEAQMQRDLRHLVAQNLVQTKTAWTGRDRETETYVALTEAGKRLLKREHVGPRSQALYTGFVKPAELRHDAAIYPMFSREAARIDKEGGRIRRVVLDYELKKKVYSPLAKAKALPRDQYRARQAEIAKENGLKVVNGHIVLPDLRIEYEDRHGVAAQLDLEVASESYHGSHAAEKAAAGFRIYASPETAARLSHALEEREITAEILSL